MISVLGGSGQNNALTRGTVLIQQSHPNRLPCLRWIVVANSQLASLLQRLHVRRNLGRSHGRIQTGLRQQLGTHTRSTAHHANAHNQASRRHQKQATGRDFAILFPTPTPVPRGPTSADLVIVAFVVDARDKDAAEHRQLSRAQAAQETLRIRQATQVKRLGTQRQRLQQRMRGQRGEGVSRK